MPGEVISIYITPTSGQPLQSVDAVRAVPGRGLEGDRYFLQQGKYSLDTGGGRELTLIESEALDYLAEQTGTRLAPGESRRNIVTRHVRLNPLVGQIFEVGEVTLQGVRLCEPCEYLQGLTQPGVLPGLVGRGGLRVTILTEGIVRVGDPIRLP